MGVDEALPSLPSLRTLADQLSRSEVQAQNGTAAALRRAISTLANSSQDNRTIDLVSAAYARAYGKALSTSRLFALHLSKAGGTGICELSKLNGCSRASAGTSSFAGNCADKNRLDGPWWLPARSVGAISDAGLRFFARLSFQTPSYSHRGVRACRSRGKRAAGSPEPARRLRGPAKTTPIFSAIESTVPASTRCEGALEMLVVRETVPRLQSFGRELVRWGLVPPHPQCAPSLRTRGSRREQRERKRTCAALRDSRCGNFSYMASIAPSVYDNQLVRLLLGFDVYVLPFGGVSHEHYAAARRRLRQIDVLVMLGRGLPSALQQRLGWAVAEVAVDYQRRSKADACAFGAQSIADARKVNRWDAMLIEDAASLDAADEAFFSRPAVARELASALAAARGSGSACGLLADRVRPERRAAALPPLCWDEQTLHNCCWQRAAAAVSATAATATAPVVTQLEATPPLPPLRACTLPPAGARSSIDVVRLPAAMARFDHASCGLACADASAYFGLESAGALCVCLNVTEMAAAPPLHPTECGLACSGRFGVTLPPEDAPHQPCGGNEATAVFETASLVASLAAAAVSPPSPPAAGADRPASRMWRKGSLGSVRTVKRCNALNHDCAGEASAKSRSLYVHLSRADLARLPNPLSGLAAASTTAFVQLGCFSAQQLRERGLHRAPQAALPSPPVADPRTRCSLGCADHRYFALGGSSLPGGACVCGDLPLVEWERDVEGMQKLKSKSLQRTGR